MELAEVLTRFGLALGIGLMIGIERGWRARDDAPGMRTAGIRTYTLITIVGAVAAALASLLSGGGASVAGGLVLGAGFLAIAGVVGAFKMREAIHDGTYSVTSVVASLLAFALGAYAMLGPTEAAAAVAVVVTAILAFREPLHAWLVRITWVEIRSALVLLAMTFVALPLLPDRPVGPWGGVVLRDTWLVAIVLAAVSFAGYVAVRALGEARGTLLAAAAGGLVSSTAVTLANGRRARAGEGDTRLLAAAALVATAVALVRTFAIVAAVAPSLVLRMAPVLGVCAVAAGALAMVVARRATYRKACGLELANPFDLKAVLGFALLLAAMTIAGRAVVDVWGAAGAVAGAFVIGTADTDSVTLSIGRLVPGALDAPAASLAILAALVSNTIAKTGLAFASGGWRYGAMFGAGMAVVVALGAVTLAVWPSI